MDCDILSWIDLFSVPRNPLTNYVNGLVYRAGYLIAKLPLGVIMEKEKKDQTNYPPYIGYKSLKTLLKWFKDTQVPSRIDLSVLRQKWGGSDSSQILSALKFLRLVGKKKEPTPIFHKLIIEGLGENGKNLKETLENAYPEIFENTDISKATAQQFNDVFQTYPGTAEVKKKAMRFFLSAADDAGYPISTFIIANSKRGPKPGSIRRTPVKRGGGKHKTDIYSPPTPDLAGAEGRMTEFQKALFGTIPKFDPEWTPEVRKSYFDTIREIMKINEG